MIITGMLLFLTHVVLAVSPVEWELRTANDFSVGEANGVAISNRGALIPAPGERKLWEDDSVTYFWRLAGSVDGKTIYAAGGSEGKVLAIQGDEVSVLYECPDSQVMSLVATDNGTLYAGCGPEGRIYKIAPNGKAELFSDLDEMYIWDLAISADGTLIAATGEQGRLYRVPTKGDPEVIFESRDPHIMCLEPDGKGSIYFGTQGDGLVYRLDSNGEVSAVFDAPETEVRVILAQPSGALYVGATSSPMQGPYPFVMAGAGDGGASGTMTVTPNGVSTDGEEEIRIKLDSSGQPVDYFQILFGGAQQGQPMPIPQGIPFGGHAVYEIDSQGRARRIFFSHKLPIYGMAIDGDGRVLVASGSPGRLVAISEEDAAILYTAKASQVMDVYKTAPGRMLICTSNPAALHLLESGKDAEAGLYTSPVFNAGDEALWGRMQLDVPSLNGIEVSTRSGYVERPDSTWSDWEDAVETASSNVRIDSPKGRYIQFRILLARGVDTMIRGISVSCLPRNLVPEVRNIQVPSGGKLYAPGGAAPQLVMPFGRQSGAQPNPGYTITWSATDPNNDPLMYDVFLRGEGEQEWTLLKDNWPDQEFYLDTRTLADGKYQFRIRASDAHVNLPGKGLAAVRVSDMFIVDNTPPEVGHFSVAKKDGTWKVTGAVIDSASRLVQGAFSLDGAPWRALFPVDRIFDSPREVLEISVTNPVQGTHTLDIQVIDLWGNRGASRYVFSIQGQGASTRPRP